MKRQISTLLTGLLFAANLANAGEGFSVGASVARATVEAKGVGIDVDGDATGWRIRKR